MRFSLIVCTYMRPKPLLILLESVATQSNYPKEIIIVDGSTNDDTKEMLARNHFNKLKYLKVEEKDRGLTKQRNFGIERVSEEIEIVCFLDDDIILTPTYFETLLSTYQSHTEALGVGGYITNEVTWRTLKPSEKPTPKQFAYDGYVRNDGSRFVLRKKLGLDTDRPPAVLPEFGHSRSVGYLPPSGKIYPVEQFMGGAASYLKKTLDTHRFSEYFEGYGLYEDTDFTLRLSKSGSLYVNTAAQLFHLQDDSGRPNKFKYGKMVMRNGWYVWRVRFPKPSFTNRVKWNAISLLLTIIRFSNIITTNKRREALAESLGRVYGWITLVFNKPIIQS